MFVVEPNETTKRCIPGMDLTKLEDDLPNPTGGIVYCLRCKVNPTFQKTGICPECVNEDIKKERRITEAKGKGKKKPITQQEGDR